MRSFRRPGQSTVFPAIFVAGAAQRGVRRHNNREQAMRDERLLALKAFYLGRRIADSLTRDEAVNKITAGIRKLEARNGPNDPLRKIFYFALLAEIFRENGDATIYREAAQKEAGELSSEAFRFYMRIVDATETRRRVGGLGGEGYITDRGIRNERQATVLDNWDWFNDVTYDTATAAVGWDDRHLSKKDKDFLYDMSLREIMEKHGLWNDA
jgi:hypothetical protein